MNKSKTLEELADKTGLPVDNLRETINHWNEMAKNERDDDFHRGESAYDRYMGDWYRGAHPNIGPVEPPFQAVRMLPGTIGTKMGAVIDHYARVSKENGDIVSGLYAAGNAKAAIFGDFYPGAGGTLGQAIVFAYRAAKHAAGMAKD
jgi:3-oxosteroid 1-dehydrogenase